MAPPITTPILVDVHGLLVRYLRADTQVSALVGKRVYARNYPDRVTLPACRVEMPAQTGVSVPAPIWWTFDGQVHCHGTNHQEAMAVAEQVQRALLELENTVQPEGVVQGVNAFGVESGDDTEWTPPKPDWIVVVDITARR